MGTSTAASLARYRAEVRQRVASRTPAACAVLLACAALATIFEVLRFPERSAWMLAGDAAFVGTVAATLVLLRRFPQRSVEIVIAEVNLVGLALNAYHAIVGAEITMCIWVLTALLASSAVLVGWGWQAQLRASLGAVIGYSLLLRGTESAGLAWAAGGVYLAWVVALGGVAAGLMDRYLATQFELVGRLSERESRLQSYFDLSLAGTAILSRDRTFLEVNDELCRILNYQRRDLLRATWADLVPPGEGQADLALFSGVLDGKQSTAFREGGLLRRDGTLIQASISARPLPGPLGRADHLMVVVQDMTERLRAEAEQAALFEIAKDIAGVVDFNEILKRVHQRLATLLPCDRIVTYYWDATRSVYRALAWHGVPSRLVPDGVALEFHSGQSVTERLLVGETVLINDIAEQNLVPVELFTHFGLTAALVVPFAVRGRRMGALAAHNAESGRRFDPHQVRLLEGIAQQVGVAIEAADLYRAQDEEAAIAGGLARVGQELISSLSSPALLDRLCQLTTEVLGCDSSRTWLWRAADEAFVPVASYGDSPEQWESMRLVKFGRSALAMQLAGMEHDGVFNSKITDLPDSEAKAVARAYGVTVGLMVPLRRGGELVGFHTADYHGREEVLGERHERIARGIGQLASLALENVRLFEELEQANRLKSDFVATMSHELRTPLNIIMGYNNLLLDGGFGPMTEDQADTLQRIEKSAEELLELITATLDLSRLDTGQVQPNVQAIALPDLVRELDAEISGLRENPDVDFAWDVAPELLELRSDPAKLKVVLKNLIGNAVKFTHAGSVVARLRGRDGGVEITVADTGAGIAREMLPVIFEPFRQGDASLTRKHGGVGLGLYIVRRLLDVLGGTIEVESTVGQGSTFRVWVPTIGLNRCQS